MKFKKLLNQLNDISDDKKKEQRRKCKKLKNYLDKLKMKAKELEKDISAESDPVKRKKLNEKLLIINKKREKGLKALKQLRKKYC